MMSLDVSKSKLPDCFQDTFGTSGFEGHIRLTNLFSDALEEISLLHNVEEIHIREYIHTVRKFQHAAYSAVNENSLQNYLAKSQCKIAAPLIRSIGYNVRNSEVARCQPIDRTKFRSEISSWIDRFKDHPLPQLLQECIQLQLTALLRTVDECIEASDDDIRRRLRSIFETMRSEHEHFDAQQRSVFEKFQKFTSSMTKQGQFAIDITSNAKSMLAIAGAAVTVLLPTHDAPKQLPSPPAKLSAPEHGRSE